MKSCDAIMYFYSSSYATFLAIQVLQPRDALRTRPAGHATYVDAELSAHEKLDPTLPSLKSSLISSTLP